MEGEESVSSKLTAPVYAWEASAYAEDHWFPSVRATVGPGKRSFTPGHGHTLAASTTRAVGLTGKAFGDHPPLSFSFPFPFLSGS